MLSDDVRVLDLVLEVDKISVFRNQDAVPARPISRLDVDHVTPSMELYSTISPIDIP